MYKWTNADGLDEDVAVKCINVQKVGTSAFDQARGGSEMAWSTKTN